MELLGQGWAVVGSSGGSALARVAELAKSCEI